VVLPVPKKVREAMGEEAIEAFLPWLEEFIKEKSPTRDEHREIMSRLDTLELRLGNLEKTVDRIDSDVKDLRKEMNERFDRMNEQMNERFDRINERFDRMNERFDRINERLESFYVRMGSMLKWTVGTLALFGTLITMLIAIGQFLTNH
jgi:chaperonin cofactor prefoldin